jgi:hypothetical protein
MSAGEEYHFEGRIAGFGTASGVRLVVGMWHRSPLGAFTDVFLEEANGHRILFAPSSAVADFVSNTYTFDETRIMPVRTTRVTGGLHVVAGDELDLTITIGSLTPLGRLLRAVPDFVATRPAWLRLIDPVAALLVPGVHTAGSAGNGRTEFYGVTALRAITAVSGCWRATDLGPLARLDPPVSFGFGSAPPEPQLADVVTTIRERRLR